MTSVARMPSRGGAGEVDLWGAVLWQVLTDLALSQPALRRDAERWIGPRPSHDFALVCALCGLEPDPAHAFFAGVCALPWEARRIFSSGNTGRSGRGMRRAGP
ncbi:hypothetical protein [Amaricoccus solimangrovi]|uniref:hypothetical protein n=1 Tax=Amaricoccus solimangrovi TaxID=2589815 RepID=UPI0015E31A52|nr:hypothetical protein [Amaricoccus solimangrovi]